MCCHCLSCMYYVLLVPVMTSPPQPTFPFLFLNLQYGFILFSFLLVHLSCVILTEISTQINALQAQKTNHLNHQAINDLLYTSPYLIIIARCTIPAKLISPCVMFLVHHTVNSDVFLHFHQHCEQLSDATPSPLQTS